MWITFRNMGDNPIEERKSQEEVFRDNTQRFQGFFQGGRGDARIRKSFRSRESQIWNKRKGYL